jgi:alkylation response protein AidB-like acyl-CoA dehydrogenase
MNFLPDPGEADFRNDVRSFIAAHLPADMAERVRRSCHASRADVTAWMGILHRKGWSAVGWPSEYGGPGWNATRRIIFEEECLLADAPPQHFANIHSVGPVIYSFGSDAQKRRYLEALLRGEEIWCQGFSEPNAGSDLASLTTRAAREGDSYLVNGRKLWTSDAHEADCMFALVRTNPDVPKQRGISFLLIDMKSPGILVRPITLLDGSHAVSEVFLDDVRVPAANLVGEEGQGWTIAKFLLANERAFSAEVPCTKRDLRRLIDLAKTQNCTGSVLWNDPLFRAKVVTLQAELDALEYTVLRAILSGDHEGSELASLVKIPGSELRQRVSELLAESLSTYGLTQYPSVYASDGRQGLPGPVQAQGVAATFAYRRATTIYGGANEVQREIISKANLQL